MRNITFLLVITRRVQAQDNIKQDSIIILLMDQIQSLNVNPTELSEQLMYYMNREKELLGELERREGDASNLKDLALAYEDLEVERNNLQAELEEISQQIQNPRNMGESTDRQTYERRILQVVHQLNLKTKECAQLEGEFKHLQQDNYSLGETIQHYEQFVNSLRSELKNMKTQLQSKQDQNREIRQELQFLRERGASEVKEDRVLLGKYQQMIAFKDAEIANLKNLHQLQNMNKISEQTYELTLNELKTKQSVILNLQKRVQFFSQQNRLNNLSIESKNNQIFKLKKQLLENENKQTANSYANIDSISKPRNIIDHELTKQIEGLKNLRPQLQVTKQVIRRKEMEIIELRQLKQAEILRLTNQIQQFQLKLSSSNNKLQQERSLYRQWKLSSDNKMIKQSVKPSNTVSIMQTYEKEVNQIYSKLQQSRHDYIHMRKTSEEKYTQLQIKTNELVFRINQLNGQLWTSSQQLDIAIKQNKNLKINNNNLKMINEQSNIKVNELLSQLHLVRGHSKKTKKSLEPQHTQETGIQRFKNKIQHFLDGKNVSPQKRKQKKHVSPASNIRIQEMTETDQIIELKSQNQELKTILKNKETENSHLQAAIQDLTASLMQLKSRCQQLERVYQNSRLNSDNENTEKLYSRIEELQHQNGRLTQQKEIIFGEINATQNTINALTIKIEQFQYTHAQYAQIWQNMDELHLGANKLGVLINLLKDGAGFRTEDTIKKIAATIENIKIHIEKVIEVKERISQE